jgi:hypothetical protein
MPFAPRLLTVLFEILPRSSCNVLIDQHSQSEHCHPFRTIDRRLVTAIRTRTSRKCWIMRRYISLRWNHKCAVEAGYDVRDIAHVGRGVHELFLIDLNFGAQNIHILSVQLTQCSIRAKIEVCR